MFFNPSAKLKRHVDSMGIIMISNCSVLSVHYPRGEKHHFNNSVSERSNKSCRYLAAFPAPHVSPGPAAADRQPVAQVEGLKMT